MASFVKNAALAASAGVAVGLCVTSITRRVRTAAKFTADDVLRLEPVLDRLDRVESRLETAEKSREPESNAGKLLLDRLDNIETVLDRTQEAHAAETQLSPITELTQRIEEQERELREIRFRMEQTAQQVATEEPLRLDPVLDRLQTLETRLDRIHEVRQPDLDLEPLIAGLTSRVEAYAGEVQGLRSRLAETERRTPVALESEEQFGKLQQAIPTLIAEKVAAHFSSPEYRDSGNNEDARIGALERSMLDQSLSIAALRDHARDTDTNLQRLIAAVERLCERTPPVSAAVLPFPAKLADVAGREADAESRTRTGKEGEPHARKPRFPLARIFALFLGILIPTLIA
jgi:vacuolar-type H+-ATPase subunit I/STV1